MSEKEPYIDCIFSEKGACEPYLPKRAHDLAKFHSLVNDTSSAVKFIKITQMIVVWREMKFRQKKDCSTIEHT